MYPNTSKLWLYEKLALQKIKNKHRKINILSEW